MPKNKEPRIPRVIKIDEKIYCAVMVDKDPAYIGKKHYCRGAQAFYYCTEIVDGSADNLVFVLKKSNDKIREGIKPDDLIPLSKTRRFEAKSLG